MTAPTAQRRDVYGAALDTPAEPLYLTTNDGMRVELPTRHWCGIADPSDATVVERCVGPTMDVGCGPGRIAGALTLRGVSVLGIDIHPAAVRATAARGAAVMRRSVFDRLPREGRWEHVVLLDGNIGIGGDPAQLLQRCRELISRTGSVLVEICETEMNLRQIAWFETATACSAPFPWAFVGKSATTAAAGRAGLGVSEEWAVGRRRFVRLTHRRAG